MCFQLRRAPKQSDSVPPAPVEASPAAAAPPAPQQVYYVQQPPQQQVVYYAEAPPHGEVYAISHEAAALAQLAIDPNPAKPGKHPAFAHLPDRPPLTAEQRAEWLKTAQCYNCDEFGHVAKDCPLEDSEQTKQHKRTMKAARAINPNYKMKYHPRQQKQGKQNANQQQQQLKPKQKPTVQQMAQLQDQQMVPLQQQQPQNPPRLYQMKPGQPILTGANAVPTNMVLLPPPESLTNEPHQAPNIS